MLHPVRRGRVEGDVIDARNVRAGGGRLGDCRRGAEKNDDEVLHGGMIVVQAGLRKEKADGNVHAGSDKRYLPFGSLGINFRFARDPPRIDGKDGTGCSRRIASMITRGWESACC